MSPLDKQLIIRKIKYIQQDLKVLSEKKPASEKTFLKDIKTNFN